MPRRYFGQTKAPVALHDVHCFDRAEHWKAAPPPIPGVVHEDGTAARRQIVNCDQQPARLLRVTLPEIEARTGLPCC